MNGLGMLAVIIGIMAVSTVAMGLIKKRVFTGIYTALQTRNYTSFFQQVDGRLARGVLPVYTRENMKLSAYMSLDDADKVKGQFNAMMKQSMNSFQLTGLLVRGYEYFSRRQERERCEKILEKMKEVLPPDRLEKYQMHYDIVFGGSIAYADRLAAEAKAHRGKKKGYLEYLLARSYESMGKKEEGRRYRQRAAKEFKTGAEDIERYVEIM
ncbi:hypothetical protein [Lacrimispora sp. JR3]|uniref:hypothetical protein n=1 Tax=Lacrimispora sinapis TaxID=3111456 RepID=UPI003749EB0B